MECVAADFIERVLFLIEDLNPFSHFSTNNLYRLFSEQFEKAPPLTCYVYKDFILPSCHQNLELSETRKKYLRKIDLAVRGSNAPEDFDDKKALDNRVRSLCLSGAEVCLLENVPAHVSIRRQYKKLLDLKIPIHQISIRRSGRKITNRRLLLRSIISKRCLRHASIDCTVPATSLTDLFYQPQLETLSFPTIHYYTYISASKGIWDSLITRWKDEGSLVNKILYCPKIPRTVFSILEKAADVQRNKQGEVTKICNFQVPDHIRRRIYSRLKDPNAHFCWMPHPRISDHIACVAFGLNNYFSMEHSFLFFLSK
ncbi:hypothetical protein QR680_014379 [Steinernema hermaphroditum]|uniref:Uncharacterized protein n=1 Tax=Steinernema hermaphroditum TaxID=289476 RepID=A0AA39M444_9BILA|nr:hypothetical protein QR680_014379 [Steinernema hermaphroditum]